MLVLIAASDDGASNALHNTRIALRHARIAHELHDIDAHPELPELDRYSAVLTVTERLWALEDDQHRRLARYVTAGGGLAALYKTFPGPSADLLGIVSAGASIASGVLPAEGGGLRFPGPALPAFANLQLHAEEMIGHSGFEQYPGKGSEVLATTIGGKPVAWTRSAGTGRTAYWNSQFLGERVARGLVIQTLELVQAVTACPVVNAGVLQADDFPAPLEPVLPEVLTQEFPGLSAQEFHSRVWYRDIRALVRRRGLKLSCFCLFDYVHPEGMNASMLNPEVQRLNELGFEAIRQDPPEELGLHGLNHNSLHRDFWPDPEAMKAAVQQAARLWRDRDLGPPPRSYVPPNNEYDREGMDALVAAFPEIRVICGQSAYNAQDGGSKREIGPEPWKPDLFCLPRRTSGYECSNSMLFDALSELATFGVWPHFIHPDDVSDVPPPGTSPAARRNPFSRPWRGTPDRPGLLRQFEMLLDRVAARFPWLTFRTTEEAAALVRAHLESAWYIQVQGTVVRLEGPAGGTVRLRFNHHRWTRVSGLRGCTCLHRSEGGGQTSWLLRMDAPQAEVTLSDRSALAELTGRVRARLMPDRRPV